MTPIFVILRSGVFVVVRDASGRLFFEESAWAWVFVFGKEKAFRASIISFEGRG